MTQDIVSRLKLAARGNRTGLLLEAADEICKLRVELNYARNDADRLRLQLHHTRTET